MISRLCGIFSFTHAKCKNDLRRLIQDALADSTRITSLNNQIVQLVNQIQELKAVNDYQSFQLEQKIKMLETEGIAEKSVGKSKKKEEQ